MRPAGSPSTIDCPGCAPPEGSLKGKTRRGEYGFDKDSSIPNKPWTNPYPAGPMKLVHSVATLSHDHSNIWMMTELFVEGARTANE